MTKHYVQYLLLFSLLGSSLQRSTPEDTHYVAAAVEYIVSRDVAQNLINYNEHIDEAARQDADIIVFPELTLTNATTSLPVPMFGLLQQFPVPALRPDLYDNLLVSISAAARRNQIYVLINVRELMDCTNNNTGEDCPEQKEYVFNTNVVFDRSGAVIDRYRKINLFGEYTHTPALTPYLGHFDTDFGVTFGHFICFDLMFQVPAVQVVQKLKITDVLFSTMWFSELPYLTAVEIQEAYAYILNVNFIAAGANNVGIGSAGSGIFSGHAGALVSIMPGVPTTRLLVARVPKVPGQVSGSYPGPIYDNPSDHDGLRLITDPSLVSHNSAVLAPGYQELSLVDNDVRCTFSVRLSQGQSGNFPIYRVVVQDGSNTYSRREIGVSACLLVACKDEDFKSCGYIYNNTETNVYVEEVEIEMSTLKIEHNETLQCDNAVYFPLSFRNSKFPVGPENYTYENIQGEVCHVSECHLNTCDNKYGDRIHLIYKLKAPQDDLVSFGIWGRIFPRDIDHNKHITNEDKDKFTEILDIIYGNVEDGTREKLSSLDDDHVSTEL